MEYLIVLIETMISKNGVSKPHKIDTFLFFLFNHKSCNEIVNNREIHKSQS